MNGQNFGLLSTCCGSDSDQSLNSPLREEEIISSRFRVMLSRNSPCMQTPMVHSHRADPGNIFLPYTYSMTNLRIALGDRFFHNGNFLAPFPAAVKECGKRKLRKRSPQLSEQYKRNPHKVLEIMRKIGIGRGRSSILPAWMTASEDAHPGSMATTGPTDRDTLYAKVQKPEEGNPIDTLVEVTEASVGSSNSCKKRPRRVLSSCGRGDRPESLAEGWLDAYDSLYDRKYYYNPTTGERKWEVPQMTGKEAVSSLPPGWQSAYDPTTGRVYYYNVSLNVTQWEHPQQTNRAQVKRNNEEKSDGSCVPLFLPSKTWEGPRQGYVDSSDSQLNCSSASARPKVPPHYTIRSMRGTPVRERRKKGGGMDPMDPSSYSDAPPGTWGAGLESARK